MKKYLSLRGSDSDCGNLIGWIATSQASANDIDWIVTLSGVEMGESRFSAFDFAQADKTMMSFLALYQQRWVGTSQ